MRQARARRPLRALARRGGKTEAGARQGQGVFDGQGNAGQGMSRGRRLKRGPTGDKGSWFDGLTRDTGPDPGGLKSATRRHAKASSARSSCWSSRRLAGRHGRSDERSRQGSSLPDGRKARRVMAAKSAMSSVKSALSGDRKTIQFAVGLDGLLISSILFSGMNLVCFEGASGGVDDLFQGDVFLIGLFCFLVVG